MRVAAVFLLVITMPGLAWAQQPAATAQPDMLGRAVPELADTMRTLAGFVREEDRQQRSIQQTAWLLLAFGGNGSTMRVGAHKDVIKQLVMALRERQDENGRYRTAGGDPDRSDQLVATLAMARCQRDSFYKLLIQDVRGGVEATIAMFQTADDAPLTNAEVALLAILADTLRGRDLAQLQPAVAELAVAAAGRLRPQRSRRDDAAVQLVATLLGDAPPPDLTIARCWPGNLTDDPLHTWIAAFAVRTLGARYQRQQWPSASTLLATREADGLWPASGDLDATTTSAMFAAVLGMTYTP